MTLWCGIILKDTVVLQSTCSLFILYQSFSDAESLYSEALKLGYDTLETTNVLLFGIAGTGKTCITRLLLGKTPPSEHNSTGVKDSARRIRNVRNLELECSGNEWKEVTLEDIEEIIAEKILSFSKEESKEDSSAPLPTNALKQQEIPEKVPQVTTDPKIIKKVEDKLTAVLNNPEINLRTKQVLGSNWIYVIDSGGQPHFHNLLPLFINGISIAIYVFRLSDKLSDRPLIKYARKDKQASEPIPSNLSVIENFKYLCQSIYSHNDKCRVLCVGTHLDEYEKMDDTRETIDKKKIDLKQNIITIDTQTEGEERKKQTEAIRIIVNKAGSKEIKIPTWWHLLEIRIRKKCKDIISFDECKEIADELNFHPDALVAALNFFHKHHIFHYYHEVLPNVVFCSTQVLLDIVSDLIEHAVYIRSMRQKPGKQGYSFKSYGIITCNFLNIMFEKIFLPNLFEAVHLLNIFEDRYIAINTATGQSRMSEYFMPSVLGILSSEDLMKQREELLKHGTPFLFHFDGGYSHCGVFCCLQVHLIGVKKWNLICKDQRKQNIAKFSVPGCRGTITLIDMITHFEIHVKQGTSKIFHESRTVIKEGILAAYDKLKMKCPSIESAFICRCGDHPAVVEWNSMRCTIDEDECYDLEPEHQAWFLPEQSKQSLQGEMIHNLISNKNLIIYL